MEPGRSLLRRVFTAGILLAGAACQAIAGVEEKVAPEGAAGCRLSSECKSGEVCLFAACGLVCKQDRDCPERSRCLRTSLGTACVANASAVCGGNADPCPTGTDCVDGVCRARCDPTMLPCLTGQACVGSHCVGDDTKHDPGAAGAAGSAGAGGQGAKGGAAGSGGGGAGGTAGGGTGGSAGQSGKGGAGGTSGSSGQGGAAGTGGKGGTGGASGSAGKGGSGGAGGLAGSAGASGAGTGGAGGQAGTSGAAGASGTGGIAGNAGASGSAGDAGAGGAGAGGDAGAAGDAGAGGAGAGGDAGAGGNAGTGGSDSCGNGTIESPEQCDGTDLGGATCATIAGKQVPGVLLCSAGCTYDPSFCVYCGNGKRDDVELCDGADLGGATCASVLGSGATGSITCSPYCGLDTSGCTAPLANGDLSGMQPGAVWPMWRGGTFHTARSSISLPKKLKAGWTYTAGAVRGHAVVAADGTIYFGTSDKKLYAVSSKGIPKWSYATSGAIEGTPAIASDGSVLVVSRDGTLYAVNPANGTKKWSYAIGAASNASPTIGPGGVAYFTAENGTVHAVDALTGASVWKKTYGAGGFYSSRTSIAIGLDGHLYVPDPSDVSAGLRALDPATGNQLWLVAVGNGETSPLVGPDGVVYYWGSAINPDGSVLWAADPYWKAWGWWGLTGPMGGVLYAGGGGNIGALSTVDYGVVWTSAYTGNGNSSGPLIGKDGLLYGAGWDPDGTYLVGPDGSVIGTMALGRMLETPAPGIDGTLLVSSDTGLVTFAP